MKNFTDEDFISEKGFTVNMCEGQEIPQDRDYPVLNVD